MNPVRSVETINKPEPSLNLLDHLAQRASSMFCRRVLRHLPHDAAREVVEKVSGQDCEIAFMVRRDRLVVELDGVDFELGAVGELVAALEPDHQIPTRTAGSDQIPAATPYSPKGVNQAADTQTLESARAHR